MTSMTFIHFISTYYVADANRKSENLWLKKYLVTLKNMMAALSVIYLNLDVSRGLQNKGFIFWLVLLWFLLYLCDIFRI